MSLRLVNLGLPKSGTTTLGHALKLAGLKVADYRIRPHQTGGRDAREGAFVADLLYRGLYGSGDPLAHLDGFDALSETSRLRGRSVWPQTDFALIEALRARHPGLRFVATRRDAFAMAQSMLRWSDMVARLTRMPVPGLPAGYGETAAQRMRWIEGHYAFLAAVFGDDPRYLELDVAATDAPLRLGAHLGIDLPWWGTANANPEST